MRRVPLAVLAVAAMATIVNSAEKPKKPQLDLRATPRFAFSPVNILLTAELRGGDDAQDYYCPEIEWDWDDGGRSVHETDCSPQEEGGELQRRFTAQHAYRNAGTYTVKVTLRRNNRAVASTSTSVTVRPGAGDVASSLD